MKRGLLISLLALGLSARVSAANTGNATLDNISFNPALGGFAPIDVAVIDESGVSTTLRALLAGKPALLVPVYYSCPSLCTLSLNGVLKAARALRLNAGSDYTIIAFSINPKDTPELSKGKRSSYQSGYNRPNSSAGWRFLTGSQAAIDAITQGIGFKYVYDAQKDQYGHSSSLVVLAADGKMVAGLNGPEFEPKDFKYALVQAGEGKVGSPVDRAITYCFTYDGSTGKYSLQIMRVLRIAAALTVLALFLGIGLQIFFERRRRLALAGGPR